MIIHLESWRSSLDIEAVRTIPTGNPVSVRGSRGEHGRHPPYAVISGWKHNSDDSSPVQQVQGFLSFPMGCTNTAAVDGRRGSDFYEVKQSRWLWQFGRGKPRLGGLSRSVEATEERKQLTGMNFWNPDHLDENGYPRISRAQDILNQGTPRNAPCDFLHIVLCLNMHAYISQA
jgi:hypothetical protein